VPRDPWTARVRSSIVDVVAIPPKSDAAVKIVSPMTSIPDVARKTVARSTTEDKRPSEGQAVGVDDRTRSRRTGSAGSA